MSTGSRLPRGVMLTGTLRGQGDLRVAGEVEGPIEIDGELVIEPSGVVRGQVRARAIVIAGQLEGNATAIELVRLEPGARMIGDARAERVSAATGAQLRGRIRTSQERAQLERMRRTTGGTLLAPYSSSGALLAPSSSGALSAPDAAGAPSSSGRIAAASPGVVSVPSALGAASSGTPTAKGIRAPVPVEGRAAVRRRDTEPLPALPALVSEELDIAITRPAVIARPVPDDDRPPAPVMPALGRRRAARRGAESAS